MRAALKQALGVGTGFGTARRGESLRGYIVALADTMTATSGFRFGVVMTEHRYSAAWRKQIVVAIDDASAYLAAGKSLNDFRSQPGDAVVDQSAGWLRQLPAWRTMPVVDTARLTSFSHEWRHGSRPETWLDAQIEYVYPVPIDATTLIAIETALTARFKLP